MNGHSFKTANLPRLHVHAHIRPDTRICLVAWDLGKIL